jgi:hypothetical protein
MTRRLRWGMPDSPPPKRPIRDSIVFYAALAVLIVLVAWATGGPILPDGSREGLFRRAGAILIAGVFFAVATAWSVYHWRRRARTAAESDAS